MQYATNHRHIAHIFLSKCFARYREIYIYNTSVGIRVHVHIVCTLRWTPGGLESKFSGKRVGEVMDVKHRPWVISNTISQYARGAIIIMQLKVISIFFLGSLHNPIDGCHVTHSGLKSRPGQPFTGPTNTQVVINESAVTYYYRLGNDWLAIAHSSGTRAQDTRDTTEITNNWRPIDLSANLSRV